MTDRLASRPASQPAFHPSIPQLCIDGLLCTGNDLVPAILELSLLATKGVIFWELSGFVRLSQARVSHLVRFPGPQKGAPSLTNPLPSENAFNTIQSITGET